MKPISKPDTKSVSFQEGIKLNDMEKALTYDVQEIVWPGKTFIIKRATLPMDKLSSFFAEAYKTIYTGLSKSGIMSSEPPYAIYFSVDPDKNETDLAAAVAVSDAAKVGADVATITIPESKALLLTYFGSFENMVQAYAALDKYAAGKQLKKTWSLEQYFSDPAVEPDPAKWRTNIYYIVQ